MSEYVEGMDALLKELYKLGEDADKITQEALKVGGDVIQDEAKRIVRKRSGETERSIKVSRLKADRQTGEKYVQIGPTGNRKHIGYFLEHGTSNMPAYPFMTPAYLNKKQEVHTKISLVIKEGLNL